MIVAVDRRDSVESFPARAALVSAGSVDQHIELLAVYE